MAVNKNGDYKRAVLLVLEQVRQVLLAITVDVDADRFKLNMEVQRFERIILRIEWVKTVLELAELTCWIVYDHR